MMSGAVADSITIYKDPFNKRIRVDDYDLGNREVLMKRIDESVEPWVEKLIIKSRERDVPFFISQGFNCEAFIKGYFGGENLLFVVKYFIAERQLAEHYLEEQIIIDLLVRQKITSRIPSISSVRLAMPQHAESLSDVYRQVFKVYPTPLQDKDHILKTMKEGTTYAFIENAGRIVSCASAEVNERYRNAELTDCATLPEAEGKGHIKSLLYFLEQKLKVNGIGCIYTIARAESLPMNKAFAQLGFIYGGRLIKNCVIYSGLENMNVWYKSIH